MRLCAGKASAKFALFSGFAPHVGQRTDRLVSFLAFMAFTMDVCPATRWSIVTIAKSSPGASSFQGRCRRPPDSYGGVAASVPFTICSQERCHVQSLATGEVSPTSRDWRTPGSQPDSDRAKQPTPGTPYTPYSEKPALPELPYKPYAEQPRDEAPYEPYKGI